MVVVHFLHKDVKRKVAIGNCGCRTEAANRVIAAYPNCEIISTSTIIPSAMYELTLVDE